MRIVTICESIETLGDADLKELVVNLKEFVVDLSVDWIFLVGTFLLSLLLNILILTVAYFIENRVR